MPRSSERRPVVLLTAVTLGLLLLIELALSGVVLDGYEGQLEPELERAVSVLGRSLERQIERALDYGVPLDGLVSMDKVTAPAFQQLPSLLFVAIADPGGRIVYARGLPRSAVERAVAGECGADRGGDLAGAARSLLASARRGGTDAADVKAGCRLIALPLEADGQAAGRLYLAVSRDFLRARLGEVLLEVAVVVLVSVLITAELLGFTIGTGLGPAAAGDPALVAGWRLPLFLLVLAEELARPFLPVLVAGHTTAVRWAPASLAEALPMALGLALAGAGWVVGGWLMGWRSRRAGLAAGGALAAAGLLAAAQAPSYALLAAALALAGLGYGMALAAIARRRSRQRPKALLSGALAAFVCGPLLGGILAEAVGPLATLVFGAALAGAAAALALLPAVATPEPRQPPPPGGESWRTTLRPTWRLLAVGLLGAAPQRLLLTGFVAFELPRYLAASGAGWAEIGRVATLWALPVLLLRPILAPTAERRGQGLAVGLGAILAGAALLPPFFIDLRAWLPAAALLLGMGQALSGAGLARLAARVASTGERTARPPGGLAVLRGCEWLGAVAGPPTVAGLLSVHTDAMAVGLLGATGAACAVLLSALLLSAGYEPEPALASSLIEARP